MKKPYLTQLQRMNILFKTSEGSFLEFKLACKKFERECSKTNMFIFIENLVKYINKKLCGNFY